MEAEVDEPAGKGTSGEQQCKKKDAGQCTERSEILYAAAVPEPGGFPLGWIKRLMLDEQSVFIKAERLFELDQDLLGQSVTMLLLKDQAAKQPAPNQAAQREEQRFGRGQPAFERTQEERKGHRNECECPEGCEAYHLLKEGLHLSAAELHEIFAEWNKGELDSFLIEITAEIFTKNDEDGTPLIDKILDTAGQKGTGKWTGISALDLGMPVTLIGEAVFARCLSALKDERVAASKVLNGPSHSVDSVDRKAFIEDVRRALYCSKMISYAQGYMLLREAAKEEGWNLNMGGIALMWRGGCIIRSRFLSEIKKAYDKNPNLNNLLMDDFFGGVLNKYQEAWRKAVIRAVGFGVPTPAFSTALAFYDGYRTARLPANLLQAQRDFFGAHTYERIDKPRGQFFHTNWTGRGGRVSSGSYNA